jgi:hypothetical protein
MSTLSLRRGPLARTWLPNPRRETPLLPRFAVLDEDDAEGRKGSRPGKNVPSLWADVQRRDDATAPPVLIAAKNGLFPQRIRCSEATIIG